MPAIRRTCSPTVQIVNGDTCERRRVIRRFGSLDAIHHLGHAELAGAVGAAEHLPVLLDAMADDLAAAVLALRRELVNRALERIEGVRAIADQHLEDFVVVVSAGLTPFHVALLSPSAKAAAAWAAR